MPRAPGQHTATQKAEPPHRTPLKQRPSSTKSRLPLPLYTVSDAGGCLAGPSSRIECNRGARGSGRPFREQMGGLAGGLPSVSDTHTHTERDYCQLGYFHNVIFVFRKLELSPECERQRGSVRSAAAAVHQAMKLLPGPGKPETKNTTAHSDQTESRHDSPTSHIRCARAEWSTGGWGRTRSESQLGCHGTHRVCCS